MHTLTTLAATIDTANDPPNSEHFPDVSKLIMAMSSPFSIMSISENGKDAYRVSTGKWSLNLVRFLPLSQSETRVQELLRSNDILLRLALIDHQEFVGVREFALTRPKGVKIVATGDSW